MGDIPHIPSKSRGSPWQIALAFGAQQSGYSAPPNGPQLAMWWVWVPFGVSRPPIAVYACPSASGTPTPTGVVLLKKPTPWQIAGSFQSGITSPTHPTALSHRHIWPIGTTWIGGSIGATGFRAMASVLWGGASARR